MLIDVDGVSGEYEVTGDGPLAILVASPVARVETYRQAAARLSRSFRVFTVGLPGSGRGHRLPAGVVPDRAGAGERTRLGPSYIRG